MPRRNAINEYGHHSSGFFANGCDARGAFSTLLERGLAHERHYLSRCGRWRRSQPQAPDAGNKEGKEGWLSALVHDAIASGQIVPVIDARTEEETAIAREIIQASVGDDKDISMA
ncbi:MAG: hypothetical protein Q7U14_15755 [Lacisediminimonas sp.]|nr:hypothetical protein [Lacisediminimonas sp.]